jgi:hypothetical protein
LKIVSVTIKSNRVQGGPISRAVHSEAFSILP